MSTVFFLFVGCKVVGIMTMIISVIATGIILIDLFRSRTNFRMVATAAVCGLTAVMTGFAMMHVGVYVSEHVYGHTSMGLEAKNFRDSRISEEVFGVQIVGHRDSTTVVVLTKDRNYNFGLGEIKFTGGTNRLVKESGSLVTISPSYLVLKKFEN